MSVSHIIAQATENNRPHRERPPLQWVEVHAVESENAKVTISMTTNQNRPMFSYKVGGLSGIFLRPRIVSGSFNTPPLVENALALAEEVKGLLELAAAWVADRLNQEHVERISRAVDRSEPAGSTGPRKTGKTARDKAKKAGKGG